MFCQGKTFSQPPQTQKMFVTQIFEVEYPKNVPPHEPSKICVAPIISPKYFAAPLFQLIAWP